MTLKELEAAAELAARLRHIRTQISWCERLGAEIECRARTANDGLTLDISRADALAILTAKREKIIDDLAKMGVAG